MSSTSGQVEAGWRVVVHTCGVGFLIAEGPRVIAAVEDSSVDGARVSNLIAAAPDLLAVLCEVEWSGTEPDDEGEDCDSCPWCGNPQENGHADGCKLAAAIAKAGGAA